MDFAQTSVAGEIYAAPDGSGDPIGCSTERRSRLRNCLNCPQSLAKKSERGSNVNFLFQVYSSISAKARCFSAVPSTGSPEFKFVVGIGRTLRQTDFRPQPPPT
jgi:hypothetical protein